MSSLSALIDLIQSHPDYDGQLDTQDLPNDFIQEVYEYLQDNGDDLRGEVEEAYGHSDPNGCLMIFPSGSRWMVRYAGGGSPDVNIGVDMNDAEVEDERHHQLVEQAYNDLRAEIEERNSKRESEWETIPLRGSKEHEERVNQLRE